MVMHTMQMKLMIYLSSRMHELKARSRDAIVTEALRSALVSGDHPKKPTRGVCEHASMCTRLQCGLAAYSYLTLCKSAHELAVESEKSDAVGLKERGCVQF